MVWKVVAAVTLVLVVVLIVLFQSKTKAQKAQSQASPEAGMAKYLGLRRAALLSGPSKKNARTQGLPDDEPSAAFMDIRTPSRTATVAAFADGTASIYVSNGGGYLGGSQTYPSIRDAGLKMISVASRLRSSMQKTEEYPLPGPGEVTFYISTGNGIYTARAPEAECRGRTHPLTDLYVAAQDVITQYRLNMSNVR